MKMDRRKYRLSSGRNVQTACQGEDRTRPPDLSFSARKLRPSSEIHFQSELNHAGTAIGADLPEQRIPSNRAVLKCRAVKLHVIEGIEKLRTEFQVPAFRKLDVFQNGNVPVINSRSTQRVSRQVAVSEERHSTGREQRISRQANRRAHRTNQIRRVNQEMPGHSPGQTASVYPVRTRRERFLLAHVAENLYRTNYIGPIEVIVQFAGIIFREESKRIS